jgi:hypothetical protein
MLVCPVEGGFVDETRSVCVAGPEHGEEFGEEGAGRREVELAGRTLAYADDGDCGRVVVVVVVVVNVGLGGKE